jgi:hypothetical protein
VYFSLSVTLGKVKDFPRYALMKASWTTIDDDGRPVNFKRTPQFLRDFVCKTLHQVGMMDLVPLHVFRKGTKCICTIGHVVAEFYANKRLMHERRQFVVYLFYLMNFRRWNYNCAFYYYLILEKIYKINKSNILYW